MKRYNYALAKPQWLRSRMWDKMGVVTNMSDGNSVDSRPNSDKSPTLVCRQSKQMRPELMTCRTESVLVPYRFFSYSPDSMNFPADKSASKAGRLTKWYSRPFRSCILEFLVVSVMTKQGKS